jgi:hypothetical protein
VAARLQGRTMRVFWSGATRANTSVSSTRAESAASLSRSISGPVSSPRTGRPSAPTRCWTTGAASPETTLTSIPAAPSRATASAAETFPQPHQWARARPHSAEEGRRRDDDEGPKRPSVAGRSSRSATSHPKAASAASCRSWRGSTARRALPTLSYTRPCRSLLSARKGGLAQPAASASSSRQGPAVAVRAGAAASRRRPRPRRPHLASWALPGVYSARRQERRRSGRCGRPSRVRRLLNAT